MDGDATELDVQKLSKLANEGNSAAQHEYAWRLHNGTQGVAKDTVEALRYLELAAASGRPESMLTLARVLFAGDGVPVNQKRAVQLMRKAATKGYACAQVELATTFYLELPSNATAKWQRRISLEPVPDALAKYTRCANCQGEAFNRCGECGFVKYCKPQCLQDHWQTHKNECAVMQQWADDPHQPKRVSKAARLRRKWSWRGVGMVLLGLSILVAIIAITLRLPSVREDDKKPVLVIS